MPVVVIWCLVILALGAMAGACAYYLAQGFTALLVMVAVAIIIFGGLFPNLPALIRKMREAANAFKEKMEEKTDDDHTT